MYLKRIDLLGFKSFGRRTGFELDPQLNAVVGPNGCGKSNLFDAIRWALGESSVRSLRGGRLEDIIFGGTRALRPLGMAEVVLTFDNSDGALGLPFREVAIRRRAYRSGESEFAINDTPCRLRDVQDLLARVGSPARSHALIAQGTADTLVLGDGEARRAALEMAAGVARYRQLGALARWRRAQAKQDTERAQAALGEMERHVAFLGRQAARARKAQELWLALRSVEQELATREWEGIRRQLARGRLEHEQAQAALQQARSRAEALQQESRLLVERYGRTGEESTQLAERLETLRRERAERQQAMARAFDREFDLSGRQEELRGRQRDLQQRLDEGRRQLEQLDQELAAARAATAAARQAHQSVTTALEQARRDLSADEAAQESRRQGLLASLEQLAGERNARLAAAQERAAALRQVESWQRQQAELSERLAALQAAAQAQQEEDGALGRQVVTLQEESETLRARQRALQADLHRLNDALAQARGQHQQALAQLRWLEQADRELQGYARGVQAIMAVDPAAHGWRTEVIGPVGSLVQAPEGLEAALAAALGNMVDAVVVRTAQAARLAIGHLRSQRLGWVTFLPLDFIRPRPLAVELQRRLASAPGMLGILSELVEAPDAVQPAVAYLLGRTAAMTGLPEALALGRQGPAGLARIVTAEGDVVVPQGPVSGGHRERNRSEVLQRARHMQRLRQEVDAGRATMQAWEARVAACQAELDEIGQRLQATAGALDQVTHRRAAGHGRLEATHDQIRQLERQLGVLRQEVEAAGRQVAASEAALQERDAALAAHEQAERAARERLEQLGQQLAERRRRRETIEQDLVAATAQAERAAAHEQLLESRREELALRVAQLEQEQATLEGDLARLVESAQAAHAEGVAAQALLERLDQDLERLLAAHRDIQAALGAVTQRLQEVQAELETAQREVDHHQVLAGRAERAQDQAEAARREWEARWEPLLRGGWAPPEPAPSDGDHGARPAPERVLRQQAAALRTELEALGSVDLESIAAHDAARQRYEAADAGVSDLAAAAARLDGWQQELDDFALRRLRQAAGIASDHFSRFFVRLFGGGEAQLRLEGDDLLASRLVLEVSPPTKRPQPALALSGGERALVAAAFLFALQELRPPPICVLDEVEAPLDEVNLERFLDVVRELSRNRQFILITHRQRTMEAASALFGVTMDDTGVSRLVVLRLGPVPAVATGTA